MLVECVQKGVGHLLEGPHWDDVTKTLLYVDILKKNIYRYDPATQTAKSVNIGIKVGAVVPTRSGRLLVAAEHRIGFFDWETGKLETVVEVEDGKQTRFNDAKCDPAGRFWAGTMGYEDIEPHPDETFKPGFAAALYCLHPDMTLTTPLPNIELSNGLAWTSNHRTMYYIDSPKQGVDAFDYDIKTAALSNRRRVIDIRESASVFPDGMCIDNEGMLWVALFNGGAVRRYDPNTGSILQTVNLPTDMITSCCWGGENYDELYVTSSKLFLGPEKLASQDTAGSLFRVTGLGVRGVKSNVFQDSQ